MSVVVQMIEVTISCMFGINLSACERVFSNHVLKHEHLCYGPENHNVE